MPEERHTVSNKAKSVLVKISTNEINLSRFLLTNHRQRHNSNSNRAVPTRISYSLFIVFVHPILYY